MRYIILSVSIALLTACGQAPKERTYQIVETLPKCFMQQVGQRVNYQGFIWECIENEKHQYGWLKLV